MVIAYSPLAQGLLGCRYDVDHLPSGSARANNPLFLAENLEMATGLLNALREIARAHDATPAQVALAWVLSKPGIAAPIVSATKLEQLYQLIDGAPVTLSAEDVASLEEPYVPHKVIGIE